MKNTGTLKVTAVGDRGILMVPSSTPLAISSLRPSPHPAS